jgi:hypothetical protein
MIQNPSILWADAPADNPASVKAPCGLPDDMNCFENGKTAYAPEVNANFKAILDRSWNKSGDNYYVKDGMIGIGTTNPQKKFHVNGDTLIDNGCLFMKRHIYWLNQDNLINSVLYNTGNHIAFQFIKNGAGGGDTIHIFRDPTTENNVKSFIIGNYTIHGNNQYGYQLLDVYGSAYIMNNLGIGKTSPQYRLDVNGTIQCINVQETSDVRYKKNVKPLKNSLGKIEQLKGISYEWKKDEFPKKKFSKNKQIGLIAQDLEAVIPELVHTDNDGYKSISYNKLTVILLEAIKELKSQNNNQIELLKSEIKNLQNDIKKLKKNTKHQ